MKRLLILILAFLALVPVAKAEEKPAEVKEYFKAKVVSIVSEGIDKSTGQDSYYQNIKAEALDGSEKGKEIDLTLGGIVLTDSSKKLKIGDEVVVLREGIDSDINYYLTDRYRITPLITIVVSFFLLVIILSGAKGFTSILGLAFSILVLIKYLVPSLLAGNDPLIVTLIGSLLIGFVSLYLAHGFNKRTTIAVASTFLTLIVSIGLSYLFVHVAHLFGSGSEEAFFLQVSGMSQVSLRGLLLSGIVIGTLGVLDDVTTSQAAAVDEIYNADTRVTFIDLYKKGISVGKEHISSLVNTLMLAYAGASLPLFLLFTLNNHEPLWVLVNSEFIAEEIIRTMVGSISLVLAVPISTFLAVYFLKRKV